MEHSFTYRDTRCWAEIDLDALAQNYAIIRQKAQGAGIMAVVKADAYGHGDTVVAPYFGQLGADWYAVSCMAEARRLRRMNLKQPILILGYTPPEEAAELASLNLTQTVTALSYAQLLEAAARRADCFLQVHLALDTGMGRIGFSVLSDFDSAVEEMEQCFSLPHLDITGAFTHFSVADSSITEDIAYTQAQYTAFSAGIQALHKRGHDLKTVHCCNSAALFTGAVPHHDLVRPGIVQYGLDPSGDIHCEGLCPALCMKATVAMVKPVKAGQCISYGRTFRAERDMLIATVTAGYADGYPRQASNKAVCSIHGKPAPQLGNICMDQLMLDVTDINDVKAGDTVTLFGANGADTIDELAAKSGTINYTIICGISRRVPRLYLKNGVETERIDYLAD